MPIDGKDLQTLYNSSVFDITTPKGLFRKVFFEVMYYMYRSDCANLRTLRKDDFATGTDESGRSYVYLMNEELPKSRHQDFTEVTYENGRMFEIPGSRACPVLSYKKYVSKLNPDCPLFFQLVKVNVGPDDRVWYTKGPLGINNIRELMGNISDDARLSRRYTNHCIKRTCSRAFNPGRKLTTETVSEECTGKVDQNNDLTNVTNLRKNSEEVTKFAVNSLRNFLREKGIPNEFEQLRAQELARILKMFYAEAHKNDGEPYNRKMLLRIRWGINQYLQEKGTGVNIINSSIFRDANAFFRTGNLPKVKPSNSVQKEESIVNVYFCLFFKIYVANFFTVI